MKVIEKQKNSKSCIICGLDNDFGVKAPFYVLDDESVATIFNFKFFHQSYPERVHGGMIGALLDEVMGRALWIKEPTCYGVTTTMSITYRRPVPYDATVKARGYITFNSNLGFSTKGELYDMNGKLLAEATAKYLKLPSTKIADGTDVDEEMCYLIQDDVSEIDFPPKNIK